MKKRFIVSLNNSTKAQDQLFVEYIMNNNLGWWHWLKNTWLLVDNSGRLSASELRDIVKDIFKNEHTLVIEIGNNSDTWAGYGPTSEDKNMFEWLKDQWKKY